MPTYMIRVLHMPASLSFLSGCVTGLTLTVVSLFAGRLADRLVARKPLVVASLVLSMLAVYPAFWLINAYPSVPLVLCVSALLTALVNLGTTPMFLMMLEMLPAGVRASGLSVIYSVGVTVFGGSSQFIVTWMLARTGNPMSPALYMLACGVITLLAVLRIRETRAH
ncbi:H+ symporter family protein [compost metagenome]